MSEYRSLEAGELHIDYTMYLAIVLQGRFDEAWRFLLRIEEAGDPDVVGSRVLWNRIRARLLTQ